MPVFALGPKMTKATTDQTAAKSRVNNELTFVSWLNITPLG